MKKIILISFAVCLNASAATFNCSVTKNGQMIDQFSKSSAVEEMAESKIVDRKLLVTAAANESSKEMLVILACLSEKNITAQASGKGILSLSLSNCYASTNYEVKCDLE